MANSSYTSALSSQVNQSEGLVDHSILNGKQTGETGVVTQISTHVGQTHENAQAVNHSPKRRLSVKDLSAVGLFTYAIILNRLHTHSATSSSNDLIVTCSILGMLLLLAKVKITKSPQRRRSLHAIRAYSILAICGIAAYSDYRMQTSTILAPTPIVTAYAQPPSDQATADLNREFTDMLNTQRAYTPINNIYSPSTP